MQEKTLGMNINVLIDSMDLVKEPWYFSSMIESYTKRVWVWPMKVYTPNFIFGSIVFNKPTLMWIHDHIANEQGIPIGTKIKDFITPRKLTI
jgi:hypothetical protein